PETRRQLIENRAEPVAEGAERRHHPLQRLRAILQLLRLGEEAIGLHGVAEAGRRLRAPFLERLRCRQPVEAVVDLHRVEMFGVKFEPAALREAPGIETLPPVAIVPA